MEQNEEKKKKVRKSVATIRKPSKHGVVGQKMMTFRVDLENVEWLDSKINKGRYINELIAADARAHQKQEQESDSDNDSGSIDDLPWSD